PTRAADQGPLREAPPARQEADAGERCRDAQVAPRHPRHAPKRPALRWRAILRDGGLTRNRVSNGSALSCRPPATDQRETAREFPKERLTAAAEFHRVMDRAPPAAGGWTPPQAPKQRPVTAKRFARRRRHAEGLGDAWLGAISKGALARLLLRREHREPEQEAQGLPSQGSDA